MPVDVGERTYLSVKCPLVGRGRQALRRVRRVHRHHRPQADRRRAAREPAALSGAGRIAAPPGVDVPRRRLLRLPEPPVGGVHGPLRRGAARRRLGRGDAPRRSRARRARVGAGRRSGATPTTRSSACGGATAPIAGSAPAACRCATRSGTLVKWFGSNTDVEDYKQAEQRLRAQLERLDLLDRLTRAIGERQDLHGVLQVVVRSLEDHLPLDFCCVCLYDAVDARARWSASVARGEALARALGSGRRGDGCASTATASRGACAASSSTSPTSSAAPPPFAQQLAARRHALVRRGAAAWSRARCSACSSPRGGSPPASAAPTASSCASSANTSALAAHQAQLYTALQHAYDDLRQTQQAVMQQERLRALGQMASGIAHDINNAISPVALYTESLLETEPGLSAAGARLPRDHPARHRGRGADRGAHARVLPPARSRSWC